MNQRTRNSDRERAFEGVKDFFRQQLDICPIEEGPTGEEIAGWYLSPDFLDKQCGIGEDDFLEGSRYRRLVLEAHDTYPFLIRQASEDPCWRRALELIAVRLLRECGGALPAPLGEWVAKRLEASDSPAPRNGLRNRNAGIVDLVERAIGVARKEFGVDLRATRNAVSPPGSACDAMSQVLSEPGRSRGGCSYETVAGAWKKHRAALKKIVHVSVGRLLPRKFPENGTNPTKATRSPSAQG